LTDTRVVLVTTPDADTAARLARTLVEERLAACGNLVPGVRSIYRWEGKVCDEAEVLLILKTTAALAPPIFGRAFALRVVAPYLLASWWRCSWMGPNSADGGRLGMPPYSQRTRGAAS